MVIAVIAVCIGGFIHASGAPARAVVLLCEVEHCPHTYAQHEGDGGRCTGQVQASRPGGERGWVPCGCSAYQGVLPQGWGGG